MWRTFWLTVLSMILLIALVVGVITYGVMGTAKYIDTHGGLKGMTERVWEGKQK